MGVDAEDCDGDGRPELFVTNFQNEHIAYYQNLSGSAPVRAGDDTAGRLPRVVGRGRPGRRQQALGRLGLRLADFDNDGWPDCFVANGHVDDNREKIGADDELSRAAALVPQRRGRRRAGRRPGTRRFRLSTRDAGPYFAARHVGRGAAFGDIDNDGDIDIVVNHMDGPPAILRNDTPGDNRWIRLKLVGTRSNRDAIGARVEVDAGGRTITRQRKGGCSMQSSNDSRLLIGLGAVNEVDRVTIRWPSGGGLYSGAPVSPENL